MRVRKTCYACPTQWEGHTDDGRYVYFRYRSGYMSIDVAADKSSCNFGTGGTTTYAADFAKDRGSWDGHMDDEEVMLHLKAVLGEEVEIVRDEGQAA